LLIKVEPAGFFMYTVQLCFDVGQPDPEDQEVRDYLSEHALEPRYQWENEVEGRQCQWMQFGGCYLGNHLQQVGHIQRKAVEVELLTEEIGKQFDRICFGKSEISGDRRSSIISFLVVEFQREASFQANENGELIAVLDQAELLEAAKSLLDS